MCCAGSSGARIRHGYKLGQTQPFFYTLVAALEKEMGEAYPELRSAARAHRARAEAGRRAFRRDACRRAWRCSTGDRRAQGASEIPGETVFRLYDTFGFPVDLTADIARERGLTIDQAGFEAAMEAQRERARAASKFGVDLRGRRDASKARRISAATSASTDQGTCRCAASRQGARRCAAHGEEGQVILDHTPFYAESGGQVGDAGALVGATVPDSTSPTRRRSAARSRTSVASRAAS